MADDDSSTGPDAGAGSATGADQSGDSGTQDTDSAGLGDAGKAALDRERAAARDAKRRAAAAEAELKKLRDGQMSDQEKVVAQARQEAGDAARAEERVKFGGRLVAAEFRAALAGRVDAKKLPALLAGINHAQFLTEDGDVDDRAVSAFADALAPAKPTSFDGGARGGPARGGTDMNALIRQQAGYGPT